RRTERRSGGQDRGGGAYLIKRQFDAAIPKLLFAIQEWPTNPPPYRYLACCYAHLGQLDKAREIVERLRTLTPFVVPRGMPFRNPDPGEFFLWGRRLAAGEENSPPTTAATRSEQP